MPMMMNDIKYFTVISETLNITRASEIIGISQSALSYAVKRLERELDGDLLIRLKNGIQLTKLGENFKVRACRLLHEWEQTQNLAKPESGYIQGSYTFAMHPSVALYTLQCFMPTFQKHFPGLDFKFIHGHSKAMTEKVISWEADFGIVVNPIKHLDLVIIKLCTDEFTVFHTPDCQNKLIYDENLPQSRYIFNQLYERNAFNSVLKSTNLEIIAKLSSLGHGYGVLPQRVAQQYNQLQKLANAPSFHDEICLVFRPEKHHNPISQSMVQIIKDCIAN